MLHGATPAATVAHVRLRRPPVWQAKYKAECEEKRRKEKEEQEAAEQAQAQQQQALAALLQGLVQQQQK